MKRLETLSEIYKYTSLLAFKHLYEYNAEEKIKERLFWQEQAIKASQDEEYTKELHEFQ